MKKYLAAVCVIAVGMATASVPVSAAGFTTKAQIVAEINKCMLNRDTTITIRSSRKLIPNLKTAQILTKKALRKDRASRPDDADYLELACIGNSIRYVSYGNSAVVTITVDWENTKAEEAYATRKINAIYKSLKLDGKSDDEKAKAIYTWVIDHVKYDLSQQENSACSALKKGTSMCQGYAGLLYRLMLKAGIPCRIVTGQTTGRHAWNALKIRGSWYFMDAVADDPVYEDGSEYNDTHEIAYDYFLKSLKEFQRDHTLDSRWKAWTKRAKIAENSFRWH